MYNKLNLIIYIYINMNNNELLVYTLLLVIILLIIGMPKDKLILTHNSANLVLGFVCVTLFMLLDKRIAIIFLILLVVTYYENMKTDLDNKVADIQLKKIKEKFETPTPTTPLNNTQTYAATKQVKIDNIADIEANISNFKNSINNLKANYLTFDTTSSDGVNDLCYNINKYNNNIGEFKEITNDTESFTNKEGFLKDYVPQPVPRAENFKNSKIVKNISQLETQNVKGQYDIQGCRMLDSQSNAIDYNTNFGPALSNDKVYQSKETVGTYFYPLNA